MGFSARVESMSFKEGRFYAIQGRKKDDEWVYIESTSGPASHAARLKAIARNASKSRPNVGHGWDEMDDYDYQPTLVKISENPFALKTFSIDTDIKLIATFMRLIRQDCGSVDVDPTSIRLVTIETSVSTFIPDDQSDDQIELRKFALEKLSEEEKELLKVKHWDVYHKLGDRSMLPDEDEEA